MIEACRWASCFTLVVVTMVELVLMDEVLCDIDQRVDVRGYVGMGAQASTSTPDVGGRKEATQAQENHLSRRLPQLKSVPFLSLSLHPQETVLKTHQLTAFNSCHL